MNVGPNPITGAKTLLQIAVEAGVDVCFANPGTTELSIVAALDDVPEIRPVLALAETVVTGAADGYGRMCERPALTMMHLGPGLANGLANLHNGFRARSPIVNLIGDHPTWHRSFDPPLATDIMSLARPVSGWLRSCQTAAELPDDISRAIAAAKGPPGQVATLIVPADCQWDPVPARSSIGAAVHVSVADVNAVDADAVRASAELLRAGRAVLFLGGRGLRNRGMQAAQRIVAATGCRLMAETFPARVDYGQGSPVVERFPYLTAMATASLARTAGFVLAGADSPVAFFARPGTPSRSIPTSVKQHVLARPTDDVPTALEALADELGTGSHAAPPRPPIPSVDGTNLSPRNVVSVLASLQPDGAIIVDEGVSAGGMHFGLSAACPSFSYLSLTGGATGFGLPCATGAAIACPDRPIIVIEGDGSAMYSFQALWTMARQDLHVITLLLANQCYRILDLELEREYGKPSPRMKTLTDLSSPSLEWTALAEGVGVSARRVTTTIELRDALTVALAEPHPHLIEIVVS